MTALEKKALEILVRIGRPVKASTFGRSMWPTEGLRNDPKKNLLSGGYLKKLQKKGLVLAFQETWEDCPKYIPSEEGLKLLKE